MIVERISTGVSGLDPLIEGGIPKGFTVLVAGNPGTGKTVLTSHFLYDGLTKNQNGIYVSFSEADYSFYNNTARLGMNFREFQKQNKFSFLDFSGVTQVGIQDALEEVLATIKETNTQRIVIDSFSAILQAFVNLNEARIALHVVLGKMLRSQGVTTLVIGEVPIGTASIGSGFEEFVADGIIKLEHGINNASPVVVKVIKMRTTMIDREPHIALIKDHGMIVLPKQPIELHHNISFTRVTSGIEGLDERIGGGLLEGTISTIIGDSGVGKTTFALEFVIHGVMNGEPGLYFSLEETYEELKRSPGVVKYNLDNLNGKGLVILSRLIENQSPDEIIDELEQQIVKTRPKRIVIDSLSSFEHAYKDEMYMITKRIVSLIKKYRLTAILTNQNIHVSEGNLPTVAKVSSLFHNIIILRYIELNFRMKRSIVFFKMRSSYHDNSILEFVISGNGVKIIGPMNDYEGTLSDIKQVIYHEPQKTEDEITVQPQQAKRKKVSSKFDRDETERVKREIMERKKRGEKKEEKNLSIDDKKNVRDKNHIKQG
jgi:RecA-superfamily ATPases implicated in signal transduction